MMNTFKRLFCVLLALATLSATAALATGNNPPTNNGLQIAVCGVQCLTPGTDFDPNTAPQISAARPGDIVVLTIGFRNASAAAVNITGFAARLLFTPAKVTPYTGTAPFTRKPYQVSPDFADRHGWQVSIGNTGEDYTMLTAAGTEAVTVASGSTLVLGRVAFRVNADASGALDFPFSLAGQRTSLTDARQRTLTPVAPAFRLPLNAYAITAVAGNRVTLTNPTPVTLSVASFDAAGKFLSVTLLPVSANAGTVSVTFAAAPRLSFALLDGACRPLCVYG